MTLQDVLSHIKWLGHASIRIDGSSAVIYIDPWKLKSSQPADIILISHEHFDHFSKEDVAKVRTDATTIVTTPAVAEQLTGDVKAVRPGETVTVKGMKIEAVAAYNVDKFRSPGVPYHPKPDAKLGFIIEVDGVRIYFSGDTDPIPEMADIKADIAILPVSGKFTMTAAEAVEALRVLKPKVAIPIHYGAIAGSVADAEQFKREASVEVRILQSE
jgi:L-ascorbate metabolism protein UlaG (beta-lactamase superfamily)